MDLEEDLPANQLVRVVKAVVNRLDDIFDAAYPRGRWDSYHPKMLTKIIIYACTQRIYSSGQIAKAVHQNVMSMWLQADKDQTSALSTGLAPSEWKLRWRPCLPQFFNFRWYYVCLGEGCLEAEAQLQEKVRTLFVAIEEAEKQEEGKHGGRIFFLTFISMRLMKRF